MDLSIVLIEYNCIARQMIDNFRGQRESGALMADTRIVKTAKQHEIFTIYFLHNSYVFDF